MKVSSLRLITAVLVAVALVATVLAVGCGSGTTTTAAPAATTTTAAPTSTTGASTATTAASAATTGPSADGKALFAQYCASCHANGLGNVAASDLAKIQRIISNGKESMPGFADKLNAADIAAIATYLTTK